MHGGPCSRMNRAREQPGIPHRFGTKIEFRKCEYVNAIYIITREPWKHLISLHHLIIMWKILSSSFLGSTRWTNDGFEEEDELFQLLKVFYYAGLGEDKIYRMGTQTASRQEIWQHSCKWNINVGGFPSSRQRSHTWGPEFTGPFFWGLLTWRF